jgi:hypothetical protein
VLAVNLVTGHGHRTMQSLTRRILRQNFPVVRSITSPEAMNEVLVAGKSVATRLQLLPYQGGFNDWRDCQYWERLRVRSI